MVEILISLIALTGLAIWGASSNKDGLFVEAGCPIAAITGLILLMVYSILGWEYMAAEHKAAVINIKHGTQYTRDQVFYAEDLVTGNLAVGGAYEKFLEHRLDLMNKKPVPIHPVPTPATKPR